MPHRIWLGRVILSGSPIAREFAYALEEQKLDVRDTITIGQLLSEGYEPSQQLPQKSIRPVENHKMMISLKSDEVLVWRFDLGEISVCAP